MQLFCIIKFYSIWYIVYGSILTFTVLLCIYDTPTSNLTCVKKKKPTNYLVLPPDLYYHLQPPDNLYFNFQSFLFPLPHPTPHTTTNQLANPTDAQFKISLVSNPIFLLSWQPSSGPLFNYLTDLLKASPTLIQTAHHQG